MIDWEAKFNEQAVETNRLRDELSQARADAPASGEPVAWRSPAGDIGFHFLTDNEGRANEWRENGKKVEALAVIGPTPSAASTDEPSTLALREALKRIIRADDAVDSQALHEALQGARTVLAAPTTSPEPTSLQKTQTSPEPDAVRDLAGVLAVELAPKFDAFLNNPGNPHLAADLRQWFWDNKSGILAALSRPAHGGWEEVAREALERIVDHDPDRPGLRYDSERQLIDSMVEAARDALARNDRNTGVPRS